AHRHRFRSGVPGAPSGRRPHRPGRRRRGLSVVTRMDISMGPEELAEYVPGKRTIRLATVSSSGAPHVVPLWFVWIDGVIFMNTTLGNATIRNLESNPAAAGVVDDGEAYDDLRGAIV